MSVKLFVIASYFIYVANVVDVNAVMNVVKIVMMIVVNVNVNVLMKKIVVGIVVAKIWMLKV